VVCLERQEIKSILYNTLLTQRKALVIYMLGLLVHITA